MSYCRCENTADQLKEFFEWWKEDPDAMETHLAERPTEKLGMEKIIELSKQILELAEEVERLSVWQRPQITCHLVAEDLE